MILTEVWARDKVDHAESWPVAARKMKDVATKFEAEDAERDAKNVKRQTPIDELACAFDRFKSDGSLYLLNVATALVDAGWTKAK